jgi:hypothetical protein
VIYAIVGNPSRLNRLHLFRLVSPGLFDAAGPGWGFGLLNAEDVAYDGAHPSWALEPDSFDQTRILARFSDFTDAVNILARAMEKWSALTAAILEAYESATVLERERTLAVLEVIKSAEETQ